MSYTIERHKSPAPHLCGFPTEIQHGTQNLQPGAIIRCDCGKRYELENDRWHAIEPAPPERNPVQG